MPIGCLQATLTSCSLHPAEMWPDPSALRQGKGKAIRGPKGFHFTTMEERTCCWKNHGQGKVRVEDRARKEKAEATVKS